MAKSMHVFALCLLLAAACASPAQVATPMTQDAAKNLAEAGVDPASSVESRIGDVPALTIKRLAQFGMGAVTNHALTPDDRRKVIAALGVLTPLQKRIVREHLRSISFADGLGGNAQTSRYECATGCVAFDIVINPILLNETISDFATRKERQLFDTTGSTLSVSIDAGSMDALTFIFLHETTHMVDMTLHLTPQVAPGNAIAREQHTAFSRGVWAEPGLPAEPYRSTLLSGIPWKTGGPPLKISQAQALYDDLRKTPFPSVYASTSAPEDFAELVALRELTGKYRQPFRIEIRDGAHVVYSYEPMKSPLVRSRLPLLARFDSAATAGG